MSFISSFVIILQHSPSSTGPYIFLAFFLSYNLSTFVSSKGHCPKASIQITSYCDVSLYCFLQPNARHDLETSKKCFFPNHQLLTVKPQFYIPTECISCYFTHFLYGPGKMPPTSTMFPGLHTFPYLQQF